MREKVVEKYLIKRVKKLGGLCIKLLPFVMNGLPDRLVLARGRVWFVETKAPDGEPSRVQLSVHKMLAKVGFPVYIIWTVEGVDQFILNNYLVDT
jgi:hypothetical protein